MFEGLQVFEKLYIARLGVVQFLIYWERGFRKNMLGFA